VKDFRNLNWKNRLRKETTEVLTTIVKKDEVFALAKYLGEIEKVQEQIRESPNVASLYEILGDFYIALSLELEKPESLYGSSKIFKEYGKKMVKAYQKAVDLNTENIDTLYIVSRCRYAQYDNSNELAELSFSELQERINSLQRQIGRNPGNNVLHAQLGFTYYTAAARIYPPALSDEVTTEYRKLAINTFRAAIRRDQMKESSSPLVNIGEKGGIDLNPNAIDMQLEKESGQGFEFPVSSLEQIESLRNVEGFLPTIINIVPIINLPLLLGLDTNSSDEPMQSSANERTPINTYARKDSEV